jgi:hypothetical protein
LIQSVMDRGIATSRFVAAADMRVPYESHQPTHEPKPVPGCAGRAAGPD